MLRIREFEERVKRTFEEHPGVIRGHTHLADGAEASIVGSLAALRDGDQLLTTYRCHGYPIALGTDPKALMAEIYGKKTGICKGYGRSMRLVVRRAASSAPRASWARASRRRGRRLTTQIHGKGQVTLCFFGTAPRSRAHSRGAGPRFAVEAADRVRDGEQQLQRRHAGSEQEDANAVSSKPLAVEQAYRMPGVTVDGGDPVAVHEKMSAAVERAALGKGPTLVESRNYRLAAHSNIIAPPGVPLHFPEHEAIAVFGNAEEYEAANRGDRVPRFRAQLVTDEALTAEEAERIAE